MLCSRVYFTLNLLDSSPHIPLILVQGDDEASAPFSPYGIDAGSYRTVRTCIGLGTGRVQSPCGVGGSGAAITPIGDRLRLLLSASCAASLHPCRFAWLFACSLEYSRFAGVCVVVVDFRSSLLDFLVLQFDGGLLLLRLGFKLL